jgi:hypothetical protein
MKMMTTTTATQRWTAVMAVASGLIAAVAVLPGRSASATDPAAPVTAYVEAPAIVVMANPAMGARGDGDAKPVALYYEAPEIVVTREGRGAQRGASFTLGRQARGQASLVHASAPAVLVDAPAVEVRSEACPDAATQTAVAAAAVPCS